ncbi:tetratricopeptide repeat protein [Spirosoma luteum]|uniref:tetratricopeptide repeat protein n=1 Tax=Spirosoma luteum TaxID=431553 RepID=UPI000364D5A5|nr:tetratricopeptide repeat protein [Spirosoma luteum]
MELTLEQIIQKVEQLFDEKRYQEIITLLNDALLIQYAHATLYVWRARAYKEIGEPDLSFNDAQKSIEIDPLLPIGYGVRGTVWAEKKDYDRAIADYTDAIRIDPNYVKAYNNRGNAWSEEKEYDKAIADYTDAIRIDPNYASTRYNRGVVWSLKEEYDKAIVDYTDAIRIDPNFAIAYNNRGLAWSEKKEYSKALSDYTDAIRIDPNSIIIYFNRGLTWAEMKEYDKAIEDYTNAIRIDPNYANAYGSRGLVWAQKKEYDKAIVDYTDAIRIDPNYINAYGNRGNAWAEKKEYNMALADYNHFITLSDNPDNYYRQVTLDKIEQLRKKIENAWYDDLDGIINEIKDLLLFDSPCLTHYTSLSGARAIILDNKPFRLSEGSFLNDTSEGRELFNYLSFETTKRTADETMAELFVERPFIGSFVAESKHNDLTLWRMYGKEAQAEAKGCALTIYRTSFIDSLKKKIRSTDKEAEVQSQSEEQFTFYNVAYLSKNRFIVPGKSDPDENKLNILMSELKDKAIELNDDQKISVVKLLNEIAYLFKSSEYQYENEVRLVVQGVGFTKKIKKEGNAPKVYIELVDIIPALNKITLGPKVERADEWAAAFNYHIKDQLINRQKKVEIVISHLPFK